MTHPRRLLFCAALVTLVACASAVPAHADLIGVRAGFYTKIDDPFIGAELIIPIDRRHEIDLNPNVEYVFVDNTTYMTFNFDAHVDLYGHHRAFAWLGAGLGVIYIDPKGPRPSTTDVGANLLAGVGLRGDVIPYIQAKVIVKDDTEFVIGFGLRF
jgi:hypothetical protein